MNWSIWFAWHPVRTVGGHYAIFKYVDRRWNTDLNPWADASGHSGSDGGFEYRMPLHRWAYTPLSHEQVAQLMIDAMIGKEPR
jgi:hypothetical protein